jgi:hypothetical protein
LLKTSEKTTLTVHEILIYKWIAVTGEEDKEQQLQYSCTVGEAKMHTFHTTGLDILTRNV